jgi:hypothetical protein
VACQPPSGYNIVMANNSNRWAEMAKKAPAIKQNVIHGKKKVDRMLNKKISPMGGNDPVELYKKAQEMLLNGDMSNPWKELEQKAKTFSSKPLKTNKAKKLTEQKTPSVPKIPKVEKPKILSQDKINIPSPKPAEPSYGNL